MGSSRAEHHATSEAPEVRGAKRVIARILERRHRSGKEPTSSKELASAVGLKPTTVRDAIAEIRREYGLPVVSNNRGYYLVDDPDELARQLERYQDRIETVKQRREELTAAFNRYRQQDGPETGL